MRLDRPSVSVAMATYNGARFLVEQLDSLVRQTMLPDELVVSDDGSTDDTLTLLRTFAAIAPFPVHILDKDQRLGFADNFLFAVEQCRGDLVALCDQDDVWLPAKLETGVNRLLRDDSLLSMHRLTMTDEALQPTQSWDQGIVGDRVWDPLALNPWSGWGNTMVFRRELAMTVPRAGRPRHPETNRPLSHDTWLYVLAAALGRVSHIAEPLILYRQHGENAFGMQKPDLRTRLRIITTVPVESYRERDLFFGALADIFGTLAADGRYGDVPHAAAERYRKRRDRARLRVLVHDAPGIAPRAGAFWRLYAKPGPDPIGLTRLGSSLVKDLLLGVTGGGRTAERSASGPQPPKR